MVPEMTIRQIPVLAKYYPKNTLIHDEEAIRAQENYMKQLLNHRNPALVAARRMSRTYCLSS